MDWIITALAVWRMTSLLVNEYGPAGIFEQLRHWADSNAPLLADILSCVWCCSVWVGLVFTLPQLPRWLKYALAASAVAIMIEEFLDEAPPQ